MLKGLEETAKTVAQSLEGLHAQEETNRRLRAELENRRLVVPKRSETRIAFEYAPAPQAMAPPAAAAVAPPAPSMPAALPAAPPISSMLTAVAPAPGHGAADQL
jgi:hypothetical protein